MKVWAIYEHSLCQECNEYYLYALFETKEKADKFIKQTYVYKWQYKLEEVEVR